MNNINIPKIISIHCEYCAESFFPTRRFVQKYCSESCRTLACKERKKGEGGVLTEKKRSTSISDLSILIEQIKIMNVQLQNSQSQHYELLQSNLFEIRGVVNTIDINLESVKETQKDMAKDIVAVIKSNKELESKLINLALQLKSHKNQDIYLTILEIITILFGKDAVDKVSEYFKNKTTEK